jgi:spore coat protein U-like protein
MHAKIAATALVALALAAGAAAANTSGTIRLQGSVAARCTVAVTDAQQSLNIVGGETSKQVGTVVENCNSGSGYTVSISSVQGGVLRSQAAGAGAIAYSLSYGGVAGALTTALAVVRDGAAFDRSVPVAVSMPANPQAIAGAYTDTITITIAAR